VIVIMQPLVQVDLQFVDSIDLLAKGDRIDLILDGAVEAFIDAISLWRTRLRFGVVDVNDGKIEFVLLMFQSSTIFSDTVGKHSKQPDLFLLEKGQHLVIEQIGVHQRILAVIQLGKGHFCISIYNSLLVNTPNTFDRAYIVGVLRTQVARVFSLDLTVSIFDFLGLL
jgi:hypothetical protein